MKNAYLIVRGKVNMLIIAQRFDFLDNALKCNIALLEVVASSELIVACLKTLPTP